MTILFHANQHPLHMWITLQERARSKFRDELEDAGSASLEGQYQNKTSAHGTKSLDKPSSTTKENASTSESRSADETPMEPDAVDNLSLKYTRLNKEQLLKFRRMLPDAEEQLAEPACLNRQNPTPCISANFISTGVTGGVGAESNDGTEPSKSSCGGGKGVADAIEEAERKETYPLAGVV